MAERGGRCRALAVRSALLSLALLRPAPAFAGEVDRWMPDIVRASARFGVPISWVRRVMLAESGGNTHVGGRPIVSRAGAVGLMQLMPGTWLDMRARLGLGPDPHDPGDNIVAGTAYLRILYDRFGYPGLFAAYNAGPGRYSAFLGGRSHLPAETRAYVAALVSSPPRPPPAPQPSASIFAVRLEAGLRPSLGALSAPPLARSSLFVAVSEGGR